MSAPTLAAEEKGEGGEHEPEVLGQQHDEPVKPSSLSAAPSLIVQTPQLPHYKNAVAPDGTQRYVTLQLKLLCAGINFFHRHIRTDKDVKHRMRENRAFAHFFEEQYHAGKVEHGLPHVFRTSVHDTSALHVSSFILSILHQGIFSVSAFIIAIIYLSRFKECSHITLHATTWRPLFLVTLLLADKMWEDKPVRNSSLAKLFPVLSNKELNLLENFMLKQLGFNVLVKPDLFCSFCEKLLAEEVHAEIVQQALMSDFGQGLIAEPFCVRQPKELQAKLHDVGMEDTNFGTYITETCLKDEYLPRELWSLMLHSKGMAVCHATTSAGGPVAANGMIKSSSGAASDAADAAVPATAASASTGGVNNATTATLSTSSVAGAPSITGGVTVTSAAAAPSQLTTLTAGGVVVGTTLPGSTVAPRPASVNPSVGGRRAASTDPTRPQKAEVRSGSQRPGMLKMPGQFTFLKTPFNMVRKSLPATTSKRSGPASNDPTRPQQGQQTAGQPQATTTTVFGAPTPTAPLPGFLTRPRIGLARQPSPFGTALRPVSAAPLRPGVGVFSQQQQQQPIATSRGGATSSEQAEGGGGGSASGTTARAAGASSSKESAGAFVHDVLTDSRKGVDNNAVPDHLGTSVGSRGSKQSAGGVSAGGPQDFVHVAGHRTVWNQLPEGVVDTQDPLSGTLSIAVAPPVVSATAAAAGSYENRYKASPLSGPSKPLITKPSGSGSMVRPHAGDSSVNAEALSGNASASASASYSEHALGAGVGCVTTSTTGINSSSTSVSAVGGVSSVGGSSSSSASHQPAIIHLATATKQYSNTSAPPAVGMTAGTPESMPGAGSTSSASRGPPRGMAAAPQHVGGAVYATSSSSSSNMLLGGVVGSKFGTGAGFGTGPTLVGGGVRQRNWSVGRGAAVGRGGAVIPNRNIGVIVGGGMGHGGSAGANAAGGGSVPGATSEGGAANPHFASGGMTTAASASTSSATIKAEPAMTPPLASQQQRSSSLGRFGFSQPRLNMQLGGRVNGRIPGGPVAKLQAFTPTAASARGHTPTPHAAEQNGDASTSYQHQLSTSSSSSSAAGEARTTGAATGYVPPARAASAPRVVGGGAAYQHFASTTQKGNHGAKQASGYATPTHPSMVMMMTSSGGTAPGGHLLSAATPPRPGPAQMQLGQPMLRGMSPFQTRILDASAGGGIGNAAHQVGVGGGGLLLVNPPFRGRSPSIRAVHMSAGGAGAAHAAATGLGLGTATPAGSAPAPPVA